jgi:hypothetical protein
MIKYHVLNKQTIAELMPESDQINGADDMVDLLGNISYNNCGTVVIYQKSLNPAFFDLKSGVAGEILQKVSNYRARLAIVGDFSKNESKSLQDFIRESNKRGTVLFVDSFSEALLRF